MLLGRLPHDAVEALAAVAVGLVCDRGAQHPERDFLAVDGDLQLGLEGRQLLGVLARQPAEVALAGEAPELADAPVAVDRAPERLRPLELGEVRVPLVDRLELEPLLQPGEMEVMLLVQFGDETVGLLAVCIEFLRGRRIWRHRP